MKKTLVAMSCFMLILNLVACGSPTVTTTTAPEPTETVAATESKSESESSGLDALGDVKVDESLFNVELTIPKDYVGEKTQEELDATAKELGYKSITLNRDGSATYIMNKKQHRQMMVELKKSIDSSLQKMIGSEDYPNITGITTNTDFTKFEVTTKSTELGLAESLSILGYYMYGGMYNIFNGTPVDNISIEFINADSGEILSTVNSSDIGK